MSNDWKGRHLEAMIYPQTPGEQMVIDLLRAIETTIAVTGTDKQRDYVSAPPIGQMLISFQTLLACVDLGRLDAGSLSTWAERQAEKIGYDLDREVMAD